MKRALPIGVMRYTAAQAAINKYGKGLAVEITLKWVRAFQYASAYSSTIGKLQKILVCSGVGV